jgi:hypothetical protein
MPWLAVKGYDPVFGARPLGRVVQRSPRPAHRSDPFGALGAGGAVIGIADNALLFAYEGRPSPSRRYHRHRPHEVGRVYGFVQRMNRSTARVIGSKRADPSALPRRHRFMKLREGESRLDRAVM